ncbi:MAG: Glu-tRNA(Gln) amidotransferase subunit GatD [Promethearchaeota archaeon]|nr:MAG: Glu-tRNA(Gln) amidotransferase subunit GatD [Candidatus Lokiarchaeota archaeon]
MPSRATWRRGDYMDNGERKVEKVQGEDLLKGYKGFARKKLESAGVKIWDIIEVEKEKKVTRGIVLPRSEFESDTRHLNLKLKSGYNVGIELTDSTKISIYGYEAGEYGLPEKEVVLNEELPSISLIGTGGTIASRLNYRTGAVLPAFTPGELFTAVPELANICNVTPEVAFNLLSEDMNTEYWIELAKNIASKIKDEQVDGVVVAHGTDTMCFTGTALSFLLQNLPVPIILVGSQRSSDRPSSDSAINLINAVTCAARGSFAEVLICMLGFTNHDHDLLHRPALTRKMHSSRRDAFKTIGAIPFGKVQNGEITIFQQTYQKRDKERELKVNLKMEPKVALIHHYPGIHAEIIETLIEKKYRGIVLAGTGLGHINQNLLAPIKRAIEEGITVVMTVQTLWGFTGMQVYERGREELAIGIVPGHNMLPETAYVKLCWVLGNAKTPEAVVQLMQQNFAGEMLERETIKGYLIHQGIE